MLVGFAPGGGVDITARLVAQRLTERLGKPMVVENRAGAAGNIATEIVAKSAPDGHTLIMAFSSHASNAALYPSLPFDIERDFTSVTLVATAPVVVAASGSLPAKTLAELIEHARASRRSGALRLLGRGHAGASRGRADAAADRHPHDARLAGVFQGEDSLRYR